jgi:hypothetical protein
MSGSYQRCHYMTPVPLEGAVHIVRDADKEAEAVLSDGGLVYVRAPRKSGKTTLARRLQHRLMNGEMGGGPRFTVWLSLTSLDEDPILADFLEALGTRQEEAFAALTRAAGITSERASALRQAHPHSGWLWSVCDAVAAETGVPVIIFVDEVEELLGKYRAEGESWLIGLRQAHQDSAGRLAACVLGQLPASLLIRSPERTPFNTARELVLPDFTQVEVRTMLRQAFDTRVDADDLGSVIARAVFRQTGGQPNITQCLLQQLQIAVEKDPATLEDYAQMIIDFVERHVEAQPTTAKTYMAINNAFDVPGPWPAEEALEVYALMLESAANVSSDAMPATEYDPWNEGHQMLEALGLAKVEVRPDDGRRYLIVRNRIALRIFGADWVGRRRLGLPSAQAATRDQASSPSLDQMEKIAREEICGSDWARKHRARITPSSGRELVEGTLFEFELIREDPSERLTLQLFKGVGSLARRLWQHQVRTLRQMSGRAGALPTIYRGGVVAHHGAAYIITHSPAMTLTDPGVYEFIREHRTWALDQFEELAWGLHHLAEEGIIHRGLWPGAIRMDPPEAGGLPARLKLASFEFSVMLRSIVGSGGDLAQVVQEQRLTLRKAYLRQPARARPYAPPEFLCGLFGPPDAPIPAAATSSVFSLGMVVATWFLSPLDVAKFAPVLSEENGDAVYSEVDHVAYIETFRQTIGRAIAGRLLPATLGNLLREMIDPKPHGRPTPHDVFERLRGNAASLRRWSAGKRKNLLVCYSYRQTAQKLADGGFITSAPDTEDSRRDVEDFIQRELRNATLFHAPLGIAPFVDIPEQEHHAAQWVLKGLTWLFYCQRYERRGRGMGVGAQAPHILRIAYPHPLNKVWRALPPKSIKIAEYAPLTIVEQQGSPEMDVAFDADYQHWDPLLTTAARQVPPPSFEIARTAFSWLVEAQREALELQRFPVKAVEFDDERGRTRTYELDEVAYRRWISATPLRSAVFQASDITSARDYFEQVMEEALGKGEREVRLRTREADRSKPRWSSAGLETVSAATIKLSGQSLPKTAQIETRAVFLGLQPLSQQAAAIDELSDAPALFDQLLQPHIITDDDAAGDVALEEAVKGLAGRAAEIVGKIVSSSPLIAMQGPPGTGKTTITAAVVDALLRRDATERILITSQSHAAVDNIALRIKELDLVERDRTICVRVAAEDQFEKGAKIDEQLWSWRPEATAERIAGRIKRASMDRLATVLEEGQRRAYEQLQIAAENGLLELVDRVREGANLVFATTAGSRRVAREGFLPQGRFDLAIVDEASKAWPTEIIQPMLIAERQLLVGDHRQLPAFGSTTLEQLLQFCIASSRDEFRVFANHGDAVQAWLKLFESFFEKGKNSKFVGVNQYDRLPGWRDGAGMAEQLDLQFRMRSDIASVVSRAFYEDGLKSDPRVDTRVRPSWMKDFASEIGARRGVLWIDTKPGSHFRNEAPTLNVDQAKLAANLLSYATRLAGSAEPSNAVVLSPYHQQNEEIIKRISAQNTTLQNNVHTVDSFQGREAEIVILSLVRGPGHDRDAGTPTGRYGFLVQPERVNVMFSRARELLIVLGDFDFFADAEKARARNTPESRLKLKFWENVCAQVTLDGQRIDYTDLPPHLMSI